MNDHVTSAASTPAPPESRRFWNWKLIGGEIILTVLGVYLFLAQAPRLSGMAGLVIGVLGTWLLLSEFRGFAVAPKAISFPSRFAKLPILSLRRMSVSPASVRELTVMQTWFSFQVVEICTEKNRCQRNMNCSDRGARTAYCVDGRTLRSGAANFSASGLKRQDNDLVILRGPEACRGFATAFEAMWKEVR